MTVTGSTGPDRMAVTYLTLSLNNYQLLASQSETSLNFCSIRLTKKTV